MTKLLKITLTSTALAAGLPVLPSLIDLFALGFSFWCFYRYWNYGELPWE